MKTTRRFDVIENTSEPGRQAPSHAGIHLTVVVIATVAAFALAAQAGRFTPPQSAVPPAQAGTPADAPTEYFPARYVNQGVDIPDHIQAF
jgi:hypothetical protein